MQCVMVLVFGAILAVVARFHQCLLPLPCTQRILDLSGAGVHFGPALTWPMIRSNACDSLGGCGWGDDATALLQSQIFYLIASVVSRCMREARYKSRQERGEEREENRKPAEEDDMAPTATKVGSEHPEEA